MKKDAGLLVSTAYDIDLCNVMLSSNIQFDVFISISGDMEIFVYFFGPIGLLLFINICLFASTTRQVFIIRFEYLFAEFYILTILMFS